jgi:hypothetical protein
VVSSLAALAVTGPVFVFPGTRGVPVLICGRDSSYAGVESDWGLAKHFVIQPTVYGGWDRYELPPVRHYYPSLGRKPGYGRLEVEPPPNRKLPKGAESYHKSWSAQSAPPAIQPPVPYDPPEVIVAPRDFQRFRK